MIELSRSRRKLLARAFADFSKYFMTALVIGQLFIWKEKGLDITNIVVGTLGSILWLIIAVITEPKEIEKEFEYGF
jgi:hypothetical protein